MVNEHLSWKGHRNITENTFSKNLGPLHKANQFLNAKAMESLLIAILPMEMLHGAAFGSTKLLFKKQKQAIKIIPMADMQAN